MTAGTRIATCAVGIALLGTLVPPSVLGGQDPQARVDWFHNAVILGAAIAAVCAAGTAALLLQRERAAKPAPELA